MVLLGGWNQYSLSLYLLFCVPFVLVGSYFLDKREKQQNQTSKQQTTEQDTVLARKKVIPKTKQEIETRIRRRKTRFVVLTVVCLVSLFILGGYMITPSIPVQIPISETLSELTTYQTGFTTTVTSTGFTSTSYFTYYRYDNLRNCDIQPYLGAVCVTSITRTTPLYLSSIITSTYVQTNPTYSVLVVSPFTANVNGSAVLMLTVVSASAILLFLIRPKTAKPNLHQPITQTSALTQPSIVETSRTSSVFKFCRECGAKMPRDSIFCEECGTKFV
jgi:ribosomal protein L40E